MIYVRISVSPDYDHVISVETLLTIEVQHRNYLYHSYLPIKLDSDRDIAELMFKTDIDHMIAHRFPLNQAKKMSLFRQSLCHFAPNYPQ